MLSKTIVHIPHSRTTIPEIERERFLLSNEKLYEELILMTDLYTDELFNLGDGARCAIFPVSRLVVDPERFRDDADEPMASRGMGAIYTKTSHGRPLRAEPDPTERRRLLAAYYDPHHAELSRAVTSAIDTHGKCVVIDAHSFPSAALPCDLDQSPNRPDICIGTDAFHTPTDLEVHAVSLFEGAGWSVVVNRPYTGAIFPIERYGLDRRVAALMVEVNRHLYMNETTGEKLRSFDACRDRLQRCPHALMVHAERMLDQP